MMFFYWNSMASYLSIIMENQGTVSIMEENQMAKCPKCGSDVAKPKKTWKMAGRPDKQGKRMQLEIALYDCPKGHGAFREVLSKKKI
jgi:NAD-dependent SIR2 family protein deacetylase